MCDEKLFRNGFLIVILLSCSMLSVPSARSWVYQDGAPEDARFEMFGPRADRLLIKLYENENAEWAALAKGEIDMADTSLSRTYHDLFTGNETNPDTGLPYNETINVVDYGPEFNYFILDMNNAGNEFLGNPPDPTWPNPVYPNPTSVKAMRQAVAHLCNRSWFDTIIGEELYVPIYTIIPPCQGYDHPEIRPGGVLEDITYPYSREEAEALLDAGGFPVNASTGWRFWDRNSNGVEESDEYLELKFYIRSDHPLRNDFGTLLADELNATHVRVNRIYASSGTCYVEVVVNRDFHLYTAGWSVGVEPDHLYSIYCGWYPWFPNPGNYLGIIDPEFCGAAEGILFANSIEEVVLYARIAQERFAEESFCVPLCSLAGSKAMSRFYTGGNAWSPVSPDDGENRYRGQFWEGVVGASAPLPRPPPNAIEEGIDNFWSSLNMHPGNHDRANSENMTIRWGFKTPELKMLNPVYASWLWDWNVLNLIYEPLLKRSPNNITEFIPWLSEDYRVGTYIHPTLGLCTKVKFTIRPDVFWSDGTPLTVADVHFTFVELKQILQSRGLANPWWWWSNVADVLDFEILDPYNFEILYGVCTVWVLGWLCDVPILPKHVWKPIAETGSVEDFAPDPDMIGSGPWRLQEYIDTSHVLLVANTPDSTVQTNLLGSTAITSPRGYHRYNPISAEVKVNGTSNAKIDYYSEANRLDYTLHNLHINRSITVDILLTYPDGTSHSESGVLMSASGSWVHSWTGEIKGLKTTSIEVNITSPTEFQGHYSWRRVFYGTLITHSGSFGWVPYYVPGLDICGSTFYDDIGLPGYLYKSQLLTPDIRCDVKDLAMSAKAFGSYPGHERWGMGIADVNNDYKIDIRDIASICKHFGWIG